MADTQEIINDSTFIEPINLDTNVSFSNDLADLGDINTGPSRPVLQVSFQYILKKIVNPNKFKMLNKMYFRYIPKPNLVFKIGHFQTNCIQIMIGSNIV